MKEINKKIGKLVLSVGICILFIAMVLPTTLGVGPKPSWDFTSNKPHVFNTNTGNVGIGTSTPATKLDVAGDITAQGYYYNSEDLVQKINDLEARVSALELALGNYDDDGDDYSENEGDCNDIDPTIHPGATEVCNGIDDNCDGFVDNDISGGACDGSDSDLCKEGTWSCINGVPQCSDNTGDIIETCGDSIDNDCDGQTDEGCGCVDNDGDGYFGYTSVACPTGLDCDDANPGIHPGVTDICNGVDDDCDFQTDEDGCNPGYYCVSGVCVLGCVSDAGCPPGYYCVGGFCVIKKPNGSPCTLGNQCMSGKCVGGYCSP